ncbi:hypothetical protein LSPH24S_08260 [Lysinibacillus sphaericus]
MNLKKLFLALLFSTLLISGCTEEASTGNGKTEDIQGIVASTKESAEKHDVSKFEEFELQEIIDGDTIRIKYNGSSEKIRFLLVDTPETNHKTLGVQPFLARSERIYKTVTSWTRYRLFRIRRFLSG